MAGTFTGRHMAAILVGFFAVVLAVNLLLARLAGATFGGVVVENSYVASQHFNRWLGEAERERRLGWQASVTRRADGRLVVTLTGAPDSVTLTALARHPLGHLPDVRLGFARDAGGAFVSNETLPLGRWRLRLEASAEGKTWRREEGLQ